jgi:hypothetical protein
MLLEGAPDFEQKITWQCANDRIWEVAGRSTGLKANDDAQTIGILRLLEGVLENVKDVYWRPKEMALIPYILKENAKGYPCSVLLVFSQSYVKHDLRKNKIVVVSTTSFFRY